MAGWFEPPSDPPPAPPSAPVPSMADYGGNPRPEDRADFVVKRLEQFIREGRTIAQGMSLRQWQEMARTEIANAIIDAENSCQKDDVVTKRWLFVCACAMVTVGFWGTLLAFDKTSYLVVGIVCMGAGLAMFSVAGEWQFRKYWARRRARKRAEALRKVEDLTVRIKRMERELKDEEKVWEERLKEQAERFGKKLTI
jgi:hypothetical protein